MVKNKAEEKKNRSRLTLHKTNHIGTVWGKKITEKGIEFFSSFSYFRVSFIICVKNH